jgi:hypothetical protein
MTSKTYLAGGNAKLPLVKDDAYLALAASNSFATDILLVDLDLGSQLAACVCMCLDVDGL